MVYQRTVLSDNTHRILFMPFPFGENSNDAPEDFAVNLATVLLFFASPLVQIQSLTARTTARNRDLNPIGRNSNIRQNFGTNSRSYNIKGFISPLDVVEDANLIASIRTIFTDDELNDDGKAINIFKLAYLKQALHFQRRLLIVSNSEWDIVTIDDFAVQEDHSEPHVYRVELKVTSIRQYTSDSFAMSLLADGIMNNLASQLVDITF